MDQETERLVGILLLMSAPAVAGVIAVLYDWLAQRQQEREELRRRLL